MEHLIPSIIFSNQLIFNQFVSIVKEDISKLKTGINGGDIDFIGPLINKKQQEHSLAMLEKAKSEGAIIHIGGEVSEKGFFVHPALIEARQHQSFIKTEIFGPLMIVIPFETKEEVLEWANDTEYGLASYVFTNHIKTANFYAENLEFGMVGINEWAAHGTELPFSGWKSSDNGELRRAVVAAGGLVVFTTAYEDYAIRAFEAGAADYLLKPVQDARLAQAVERMQARLAETRAPDLRTSRTGATDGCASPDTRRNEQPACCSVRTVCCASARTSSCSEKVASQPLSSDKKT